MEAQARNFEKTANGVRWEAVIFSSEFNRNKAYFDVAKMKRWASKLNKVLLNNSHNGKYFSITTDKVVEIKVEFDDDGVTECYAIVESTNPEKIANPEIVTGFSIEILVDDKDVISNENGEYYIDYEWIGLAYLLGELAGSGDTRLLSMRTFAQAKSQTDEVQQKNETTTINTMKFKLYSKLTKKFMYMDLGDIVLDNASNQPAFIVGLSMEESATTVELELFDGSSAVYSIPTDMSEDDAPISWLGLYGAIKYIVQMIRSAQSTQQVNNNADEPTDPVAPAENVSTDTTPTTPPVTDQGDNPDQVNQSADANLDQNLAVFDELDQKDRQNKMKAFNKLTNSEELAEGNETPATDTVEKSFSESISETIKSNLKI